MDRSDRSEKNEGKNKLQFFQVLTRFRGGPNLGVQRPMTGPWLRASIWHCSGYTQRGESMTNIALAFAGRNHTQSDPFCGWIQSMSNSRVITL